MLGENKKVVTCKEPITFAVTEWLFGKKLATWSGSDTGSLSGNDICKYLEVSKTLTKIYI